MTDFRRAIFVDTSAYYALGDRADVNHSIAIGIWSSARRDNRPIVTSNMIVSELHALVVSRKDSRLALQAIDAILRSDDFIVRVSSFDEHGAVSLLRRFVDKQYSFTDAASFLIMNRLGISTAFSFDRHFVQHGFEVLGIGK